MRLQYVLDMTPALSQKHVVTCVFTINATSISFSLILLNLLLIGLINIIDVSMLALIVTEYSPYISMPYYALAFAYARSC